MGSLMWLIGSNDQILPLITILINQMGLFLLCLTLFSSGSFGGPFILDHSNSIYDDLDDLQLKTDLLLQGWEGFKHQNEPEPIKTSLAAAVEAAVQPFGRQMMSPLGNGGSYTVTMGENGRVTIDFFPEKKEMEKEKEKKPAKKSPKWEYVGSSGIEYWGEVASKCLGKQQSPINLDVTLPEKVGQSGDLKFVGYDKVNHKATKLKNKGSSVQLDVLSGSPT